MKRRIAAAKADRPRSLASLNPASILALGPVIEHLGVITYDDGTARQNGVVILLCQGAEYVALAKDPDSELQLRARGATLYDALESLSVLLSQEDTPWEPDTRPVRRGGGKTGK